MFLATQRLKIRVKSPVTSFVCTQTCMLCTPYAELVFIFCVVKDDKIFQNVPKICSCFFTSGNSLSLAIEGIETWKVFHIFIPLISCL